MVRGSNFRDRESEPLAEPPAGQRPVFGLFTITDFLHPPLHCHVRKDGKFIGKYNLENGTWMTGPKRHEAQANAAIKKWREKNGI